MNRSSHPGDAASPPRLEHARLASTAMVCSVDHVASAAGMRVLADGGNAADAAVATSAALAVTTQYMCGMGGDLFALVHDGSGDPVALNASGRAGSGADAQALRDEGFTAMPFRGDIRSTPIPGCVDGWLALHEAYGRVELAVVLAPAIELAEKGFAASIPLARAAQGIADVAGADDFLIDGRVIKPGERVRRPGLARSLRAIIADGRDGWYLGEFGQGLIEIGAGLFSSEDLAASQANWVEPISMKVWDHTAWTTPPNSQGYLSLAGAAIAAATDALPSDPADPLWAHLLIEASKQAAFDRGDSLFEGADGSALVGPDRVTPRAAAINPGQASDLQPPSAGGGTIYMCAVDGDRKGVSLIQSNAAGFGAHIAVPGIGVFLHNRGLGFSLLPGHPAELGPGRRPPSTLSPALITSPNGRLRTVLGTMGGDGQPQVVLQMMAHLLQARSSAGTAVTYPRFTLTVPDAVGFDTWDKADRIVVALEAGSSWADGLRSRGHDVQPMPWGQGLFGHAHLIDVADDHLAGVAEPRSGTSGAIGI